MTPGERPLGVSVLSLLATIGAVAGFLLAVVVGTPMNPEVLLIALAMAAVYGLVAYGLWTLRSWAWPLALVLYVLNILDAVRLLTENTFNTNLVIGPRVILYLLKPSIRRSFSH